MPKCLDYDHRVWRATNLTRGNASKLTCGQSAVQHGPIITAGPYLNVVSKLVPTHRGGSPKAAKIQKSISPFLTKGDPRPTNFENRRRAFSGGNHRPMLYALGWRIRHASGMAEISIGSPGALAKMISAGEAATSRGRERRSATFCPG